MEHIKSVVTYRIPGMTSNEEAHELILKGSAPVGMYVEELVFGPKSPPFQLPPGLKVRRLLVDSCSHFRELPDNLSAYQVLIRDCEEFHYVPASADVWSLELERCPSVSRLPERLRLTDLRLQDCPNLRQLPDRMLVDHLEVKNCAIEKLGYYTVAKTSLIVDGARSLREVWRAPFKEMVLRGCTGLTRLPYDIDLDVLSISGCVSYRWPDFAMVEVNHLNIRDCPSIRDLPGWLTVRESIDVAGSGVSELPGWLKHCGLRWRGVHVDERIAFDPESIEPTEVLHEQNAELRRVMLERIGLQRFMDGVDHVVLDRDQCPGGPRSLIRVDLVRNEPIVALSVFCPSTGNAYFLRVPPHMTRCHAAAAWIAGFDSPDEYRPLVET